MTAAHTHLPATAAASAVASAAVSDGRINQRTLVLIRWVAIVGQFGTLLIVSLVLGFDLPIWPALAAVGASVVLNIAIVARRRSKPRLPDRDAALYLAFDILQLSLLLFLTGGLTNPFAVMILAPLTVAASSLSRVSVVLLSCLELICIAGLASYNVPLLWPSGAPAMTPLYSIGVWLALSLSAIFIAAYVWSVANEGRRVSTALSATQIALAREQQLSALGALAAAAAHELGSPLGTIAVVARELSREIADDDPLAEDIRLLQSQVARCRDILAELSRKPEPGDATPFDRLPISVLIEAAAAAHRVPHVAIDIRTVGEPGVPEPQLARNPEVLQGLGNILHNAIEFAALRVEAVASWSKDSLTIVIRDDGPGFPPGLLSRLGEPYLSTRGPRGGHMGLGIFIAQTLLQRTGAEVEFANRPDGGAEVVIRWNGPILG